MNKTVILLHGWTMRGLVFENFIDLLPPEYNYVMPDLPGHGNAADLPPTISACAMVLDELVRSSIGKPTVVGWSMGAAVAWRYILNRGSADLSGLITLDMSPRISPDTDWSLGILDQTEEGLKEKTQNMKTDWASAARSISATMFAKGSDPVPFGRDEALRQILGEDPNKMHAMWADLVLSDARDAIDRVHCPWLIAYGAKSRVYGEDVAEWLENRAPNGRLARFENSGHSIHLEEPNALAAEISRFLHSN